MRHQHVLHLGGDDVEARDVQQVVGSAVDPEAAVSVAGSEVPRFLAIP